MPYIITTKTRQYRDIKPPVGSQINWGHPLSRGLVGCWLMNEGGGTVTNLAALRKTENTSSLAGGAGWSVGSNGACINLDNTNDFVSLGTGFSNDDPRGFSVVSSFMLKDVAADHGILHKWDSTSSAGKWTLFFDNVGATSGATDVFSFGIFTSNDLQRAETPSGFVVPNKIYQIVGVYNPSSGGLPSTRLHDIFVDGVKRTAYNVTNAGTSVGSSTVSVRIGINNVPNSPLNGKSFYSYIYKRVLSPSEIQQLYIEPYCFISRPSTRRIILFGAGGATNWEQSCLENVTLTDIYSRQLSLIRTLSDSITLTDIASFLGNAYSVTLLDSLTMNELRQRTLNRVLMEAITLTEFMSKLIGRALLDALTLTEVIAALKLTVLVLSEQITTTDSIRKDMYRTILDVIAASDSITTPQATFTTEQTEVLHLIDTLKYWVTRRQQDSSWSSITSSTGLWTPGATGSGSWFNINDP